MVDQKVEELHFLIKKNAKNGSSNIVIEDKNKYFILSLKTRFEELGFTCYIWNTTYYDSIIDYKLKISWNLN